MRRDTNLEAFSQFLNSEWHGSRRHSYSVPLSGRSAVWSRRLDPQGVWTAYGLNDARLKYFWNGSDFEVTSRELAIHSAKLRAAIHKGANADALRVIRKILAWGGVDNPHRQKRTFDWLDRNSEVLCTKLLDSIRLLRDDHLSLVRFDGHDLIMNSAITKIVSLADEEERLVIYDSRVAAALAFFAIRFAEERGKNVPNELRFAVANERRRNPSTADFPFGRLFGSQRDVCHASMVRLTSTLIQNVASGASPREIEAALFMWGYDISQSKPVGS